MKPFNIYHESVERRKKIQNLMMMIKNPDPERVAEYGGGDEYINMLRKKASDLINLEVNKPRTEDNEHYDKLKKLSDKELYDLSVKRDLDSMIRIADKKIDNRDEILGLLSISTPRYGEEDAQDRCKRKADQVYGKKTSAYKSGAIVRCRKGKIWKKK